MIEEVYITYLIDFSKSAQLSTFFVSRKKKNLLIYNRVVGKMKVVYPFYESVIIKKPKKVNV